VPSLTYSTINSPLRPTSGQSYYFGGEIAGLGGTVRSLRPVIEYKRFTSIKGLHPSKEGHQVLGFRLQGSFLTGYGGLVAPPFERFYLGGDQDLRGFDIRSVSPVAFVSTTSFVTLLNPDNTPVPISPNNPRAGAITVPIPLRTIIFPGGDTSLVSNVEYRIPIVGPVNLAPFVDTGMNFAARNSQLSISNTAFSVLTGTGFGCGTIGFDPVSGNNFCINNFGAGTNNPVQFQKQLQMVPGTNYVPRMSTGLELQVMMPVINAPFRVYWAYNPLLLHTTALTCDTTTANVCLLQRSMFPPGATGDYTFQQTLRTSFPNYLLKEPRKTFRFTVSTTF
jgi:outer membrane protein insertion porin family